MGAWAHGGFDNDDALDLVDELTASKTWHPVFEAFGAVIVVGDDYLEAPAASRALAAAEVIAASLGRPAAKLPDEVAEWVKGNQAPKAELVEKARRVVERILKSSELKELWEESADSNLWHHEVEGLVGRLGPKDE